jgi:uncharacterized glyoxalase superfamily protein PhnB
MMANEARTGYHEVLHAEQQRRLEIAEMKKELDAVAHRLKAADSQLTHTQVCS